MHVAKKPVVPKQIVKKLHIAVNGHASEEDYYNLITQTPLQHYINECLFESIAYAHVKKRKFAQLLEIGGSGRILKLEKEHWKSALENILPTYEKMEEYKLCGTIKKLIDELHNGE